MPIYTYEDDSGSRYDVNQKMSDKKFKTLYEVKKAAGDFASEDDKEIKVRRILYAPLNRVKIYD